MNISDSGGICGFVTNQPNHKVQQNQEFFGEINDLDHNLSFVMLVPGPMMLAS